MKKIFLISLFLSSQVFAIPEIEQKKEVLRIMEQYAPLVSCGHSFGVDATNPTNMNDIYTVEYNNDMSHYIYYVLWGGDLGCGGGSGTMSTYITEVAKYGDWKPFIVYTNYAFGENVGINYRFIESVKRITSNVFEVVAWDYADAKYGGVDGGNNFPANKFRYRLEKERFEQWKITNQSLLEQNK